MKYDYLYKDSADLKAKQIDLLVAIVGTMEPDTYVADNWFRVVTIDDILEIISEEELLEDYPKGEIKSISGISNTPEIYNFEYCSDLEVFDVVMDTSMGIEDGIEFIFDGCSNLRQCSVINQFDKPESSFIGFFGTKINRADISKWNNTSDNNYVFEECYNLRYAKINPEQSVLYGWFSCCKNLKVVDMPDYMPNLYDMDSAFEGTAIESFKMPYAPNLEYTSEVFINCKALKYLQLSYLPVELSELNLFSYCSNLEHIDVDEYAEQTEATEVYFTECNKLDLESVVNVLWRYLNPESQVSIFIDEKLYDKFDWDSILEGSDWSLIVS